MADDLKITRNQLSNFIGKDFETIKQFENLFLEVRETDEELNDHVGDATIHFIDRASIPVNQISHGLSVQESVYYDGTNWAKAKANSLSTIGVGIVESVSDEDNFVVVTSGNINGLTGLLIGNWYYTSDLTAGLLTTVESAVYSNPMLVATSTTTGVVVPLRAQDIGGSSQRVTRAEYDSTFSQYLYTGTADPGSSTSASVWRISRFDFTDGGILYADGNELFDNVWDDREALSYS